MAVQGLEDEIVGLEIYLGERTRSPDAAELQVKMLILLSLGCLAVPKRLPWPSSG